MGDGLQYPTLNQQHTNNATSYHSMDDTRNRLDQQSTDKLINTATTEVAINNTTNSSSNSSTAMPKTEDLQLSTVVIDMNDKANSNNAGVVSGSGGDGSLTNGNVILNIDLLNANNIATIDTNSNTTYDQNIVEIHPRT